MKRLLTIFLFFLLSACASYSGRGLVAGEASSDDVLRTMGTPAMQWTNADGSRQFAYPRGPMGYQTFMVYLGADGKLQTIENVLTTEGFARIQKDMTQEQVLRLLGPVTVEPTYFAARDELVWGWPYCDAWRNRTLFYVLFDGTKRTVRSTMSLRESCGKYDCAC